MEEAVETSSDVVLAGRSPRDCLHAFQENGVHDVRLVIKVYSVLSALLVLAMLWTMVGRVKSRALLLALLTTTVMLIPVDTGPSPCRPDYSSAVTTALRQPTRPLGAPSRWMTRG